jgi:hypothetical protein
MKKILFGIAALTAIVVMGSCSNDSDLTNSTVSSKTVGDVMVSLNINPGVKVSESNSSMAQSTTSSANKTLTRAAMTRADASTTTVDANNPASNFTPSLPSSYTAYFVATTDEGDYKPGEIVRTATVQKGSNSLKIPAIHYKIYVTNYTPTANITGSTFKAGNSNETSVFKDSLIAGAEGKWNLDRLEANLPTSSTTLYLFGDSIADFSNTTGTATATVRMVNHYAAVCVAHNDFVSAVNYATKSGNTDNVTAYNDGGSANWYNLYIRVNSVVSDAGKTNSWLTLENITGLSTNSKTGDGEISENNNVFTFLLDKTIAANNIYQYTINDNYSGGANLTVTATAFNGTPISGDLSVY